MRTLSIDTHDIDMERVQTDTFSMEIQTCVVTRKGLEVRTVDISSVLSFVCRCPKCKKGFASKYSLKLHMKSHSQGGVERSEHEGVTMRRKIRNREKRQEEPSLEPNLSHGMCTADIAVLKREENDDTDNCDVEADENTDGVDRTVATTDTGNVKIGFIRTACLDIQTESKAEGGNTSVGPVGSGNWIMKADFVFKDGENDGSDDAKDKDCSIGDDYTPDDDDDDDNDSSDNSEVDGDDNPDEKPHSSASKKQIILEQLKKAESCEQRQLFLDKSARDCGGVSKLNRKSHKRKPGTSRGRKELPSSQNLVSQEGLTKREKRSYTRKEDDPLKCELCGKKLRGRQKYIEHMNMHTGRKPYKCSVCGQAYPRISQLNVHSRIHRGEDLHTCTDCGKQFTMPSALRQHSSIHTGVKPHQCTICGKQFRLKNILVRHMGSHTGEKPHLCTICGKAFTKLFSLKDHLALHENDQDMPFACSQCDRAFKYRSKRNHHMRTVHEKYSITRGCARKEHEHSSTSQVLHNSRHEESSVTQEGAEHEQDTAPYQYT